MSVGSMSAGVDLVAGRASVGLHRNDRIDRRLLALLLVAFRRWSGFSAVASVELLPSTLLLFRRTLGIEQARLAVNAVMHIVL